MSSHIIDIWLHNTHHTNLKNNQNERAAIRNVKVIVSIIKSTVDVGFIFFGHILDLNCYNVQFLTHFKKVRLILNADTAHKYLCQRRIVYTTRRVFQIIKVRYDLVHG